MLNEPCLPATRSIRIFNPEKVGGLILLEIYIFTPPLALSPQTLSPPRQLSFLYNYPGSLGEYCASL